MPSPPAAGAAPARTWTRRPEYTEALRGAYVVIVADRDEAGRRHAREVDETLRDVAAEVTLVEAATTAEHADAADHLAAGFGLDDFAPLSPALPSDEPATVQPAPASRRPWPSEQRILDQFTDGVRTRGVVGEERNRCNHLPRAHQPAARRAGRRRPSRATQLRQVLHRRADRRGSSRPRPSS